jgi:hypothetical protein
MNGTSLAPSRVPDASRIRIAAVDGGSVSDDGHAINLSVALEDGGVQELSFPPAVAAACRAIMADLIGQVRKLGGSASPGAEDNGGEGASSPRFPSPW